MVIALEDEHFLQQNTMSTRIPKKRYGKRVEKRHDLATMKNADLQYSVILALFNIGGGQRKISHNKRFVQIAIQKSHGLWPRFLQDSKIPETKIRHLNKTDGCYFLPTEAVPKFVSFIKPNEIIHTRALISLLHIKTEECTHTILTPL
jgi:hypothetical protein